MKNISIIIFLEVLVIRTQFISFSNTSNKNKNNFDSESPLVLNNPLTNELEKMNLLKNSNKEQILEKNINAIGNIPLIPKTDIINQKIEVLPEANEENNNINLKNETFAYDKEENKTKNEEINLLKYNDQIYSAINNKQIFSPFISGKEHEDLLKEYFYNLELAEQEKNNVNNKYSSKDVYDNSQKYDFNENSLVNEILKNKINEYHILQKKTKPESFFSENDKKQIQNTITEIDSPLEYDYYLQY